MTPAHTTPDKGPPASAASALGASGPLRATVGADPAVRLAFSDRQEIGNVSWRVGVGDVARARAGLTGLVGLTPDDVVGMEQVHGCGVARVGPDDRGRGAGPGGDAVPAVDALVTSATDIALIVLVADCVPVLLVDPGRGVGVAHAGRRGVAAGVVAAAVEALTPTPGAVVAVVGPGIAGACYEVERELVEDVARVAPAARTTTRWGSPGLDLPAAVRAQLTAAGVGRIESVGGCTHCETGRWFSHRVGDAGRQAGVVARRASRDGAAVAGDGATAASRDVGAERPAESPCLH